jgi:hypothetical protein
MRHACFLTPPAQGVTYAPRIFAAIRLPGHQVMAARDSDAAKVFHFLAAINPIRHGFEKASQTR